MVKNKEIGTIRGTTGNYILSFEIIPTDENGGNVLYFDAKDSCCLIGARFPPILLGDNCCQNGTRSPAIWLGDNATLRVSIQASRGDYLEINPEKALPLNVWTKVILACNGHDVKLSIGEAVYTAKQPTRRFSGYLTVYASNPWWPAANAEIRNLNYTILPADDDTIQIGQLCSQPNDLVVSSSSDVYVSTNDNGSGRVYRLNGTLIQQEPQEVLRFPSCTTILRMTLSSDESRLIVCVSNKTCISYIANDWTNGSVVAFQNSLASSTNVALVSAPVIGGENSASSFYVGSSSNTVILIGQYGLDRAAGSVSRSSGNLFSVTAGWFTRNWFGGFVAGSYTYFVVLDVSTLIPPIPGLGGMRVLRVCDNSNETSVAAMYEAEIDCFSFIGVDSTSTVVGVSLLESFPSGGATLVIGLVTPYALIISRVCAFGLSSVDSAMDTASCSGTSLPWRATVSSAQSCPNKCNITSPGAVGTPIFQHVRPDLMISSYTDTYTSTLAFNYESISLLFIASGSSIQAVSIVIW